MRSKSAKWLEFKAIELQSLASIAPYTIEKTLRWHSMCYPIFRQFYEEFYDAKGRHLKIESLNPIQDIGLSIWFGDAGKVVKDRVVLNTHVWGKKGTETIAEFFGYCDYQPEIFKEKNCWRIRLDVESSKRFIAHAGHHLPSLKMR